MAEVMQYGKSARFTPREKLALHYADAIMFDPAQANDALWSDLHAEFSEPELVEMGYWIGFTFGGQRWLKTLRSRRSRVSWKLFWRRGRRAWPELGTA